MLKHPLWRDPTGVGRRHLRVEASLGREGEDSSGHSAAVCVRVPGMVS